MRNRLFAQMLATIAIALGASTTMIQPSYAQRSTYFCGTSKSGVPTTFARTATGKKIPVIRWVSNIGGVYTPLKRCQEVSARFQRAYAEGVLNYLTTGIINREQVVCTSSQYGGSCGNILFTLKPGQNASEVLQALFGLSYRAQGPLIQSEDGEPRIYIDMNLFLREAPDEAEN